MSREKVQFPDKEAIQEFWNDVYYEGSSATYEGQTYTHVDKVHGHHCDGECADWILKRESDGKYFKLDWWDAGEHNGYIFADEGNYLEEVFPKQIITVEYE